MWGFCSFFLSSGHFFVFVSVFVYLLYFWCIFGYYQLCSRYLCSWLLGKMSLKCQLLVHQPLCIQQFVASIEWIASVFIYYLLYMFCRRRMKELLLQLLRIWMKKLTSRHRGQFLLAVLFFARCVFYIQLAIISVGFGFTFRPHCNSS